MAGASGTPCEYCTLSAAVVICRADSARLCLVCDRLVHSANALSLKHVRSRVCDGCGAQPATARCSTDALSLCSDCDFDAHARDAGSGSDPAHARSAIEGFSGCPSAFALAAAWGVDLDPIAKPNSGSGSPGSEPDPETDWSNLESFLDADPVCQDLYVPCAETKQQKCSSLLDQLIELASRDSLSVADLPSHMGRGSPVPTDLNPKSPCRSVSVAAGQENEHQIVDYMPFTSLLMMTTPAKCVDFKGQGDRIEEDEEFVWDCGPNNDHSAQIWDFNLGRSGDHESSQFDIGYGINTSGFTIKTYSDLLKENSFSTTKVLEDMYDSSCPSASEDVLSTTIHHISSQNFGAVSLTGKWNSNHSSSAAVGLTPAESAVVRSLCSHDPVPGSANEISFGNEMVRAVKKVDSELLAQNRGNAMLRYKEKRKNRRHGLPINFS
ncbi:zinc finger protein CONSTANS-LIKE 14-like [Iris pallida]|uniref:Zinc finger protein CONSTANS-LIKE 14-like n=1 Tax=Iris pallida TaxID=29817 RepID=A0AAX6IEL7_IRIPA|nr:zinc finger protein CONSTANS-LIKE 14-like [Iris pallida]